MICCGRCFRPRKTLRHHAPSQIKKEQVNRTAADRSIQAERYYWLAKELSGQRTPRFCVSETKIAIFVDGCFWHGHDCRNTRPADHQEYWQKKRERNMQHDKDVTAMFGARGWTVLRIWECELKKKNMSALESKILELQNGE